MPGGRKQRPSPQEQRAFGLTILRSSHPEIRRLQHEAAAPCLHGQKVWRSSFVLMDYLQQQGVARSARVLELGCGWGLVGIYCAKTFHAHVTGLDADAAVFPYLTLHAQLNGVRIQTWQRSFAQMGPQELAAFDVIVGADICFWEELVDPLYHLVQHGIKAGVTDILVADPDRPPFDDLCARCEKHGNAEVVDWQLTKPIAASGRILRITGNA